MYLNHLTSCTHVVEECFQIDPLRGGSAFVSVWFADVRTQSGVKSRCELSLAMRDESSLERKENKE